MVKDKKSVGFILTTLIIHLNDILFGLYLLIVFCADQHFGKLYAVFENQWLGSIYCNILVFCSTFSMLNSLFLLNFITTCSLIVTKNPFHTTLKRQKPVLNCLNTLPHSLHVQSTVPSGSLRWTVFADAE